MDLTGELIAAPRDRSDEITVSPQCLAQCGDLGLKVVFLDDPIGPDQTQQPVLVDDGPTRVDEGEQRVEGPTAQRDRPAVHEEFSAVRHELEPAELQDS